MLKTLLPLARAPRAQSTGTRPRPAVAPAPRAPQPPPLPQASSQGARAAAINAAASGGETNPYLEARREWNERYGDYIKQAHHWRTVAVIAGLVSLVSVSGVAYIGAQSKIVPYVVEVDKLGEPAAVARADRAAPVDSRVVKAYLARFIADWRTVTVDRPAQKGAIDRVYAMLPGGSIGVSKVNDFFKANNPFVRAAQESVAVAITNILPISEKTWQVEWQEVARDSRGMMEKTVRMKASIIVGIKPPTQENLILVNPIGVYLTDLNWSQQF
jgi:type IV secretion system protein TrbF